MKYTTPYGAFEIDAMPGQPQLALCHSFFVPEHNRGKGYGHRLKQHQIDVLIDGLFDIAICTAAGDNHRQHAVLESAGWDLLGSFKNSRIGGLTMIYGFDVAAARQQTATAARVMAA